MKISDKIDTTDKPFVAVKCAQTLDGKIATAQGQSKWITSVKARQYAKTIRDEYDAILVGINTVIKDNPSLNGSTDQKKIKKIIVDSSLKISTRAKIFYKTDPCHCIIATTPLALPKKIKTFQNKGVTVIVCPKRNNMVNLIWLFKELTKQGVASILIEGGARIIGSALKADLVDKMYIYIAPKIIGDQKALSAIAGMRTTDVNKTVSLKKMNLQKIDRDILITGYVHRDY